MLRSTIVLLSSVALAVTATAQTITLPRQAAGAEGNSSTAYPWQPTLNASACIRAQCFYASANFLEQGVAYPIFINAISWRGNGGAVTGAVNFPSVEIKVSTATPGAVLAPNPVFASNHGPDVQTVLAAGPISTLPLAGTTPNSFLYTLTLATPFPFDPRTGDLCIDVSNQNAAGTAGPLVDQVTGAGAYTARVWDSAPNATTQGGTGNNQPGLGMVVELGFSPQPGLWPAFTATPTSGQSPLAVTFTSTSVTDDPNGVLVYEWDFENDGIVDSNLPNPTHVFGCGDFDVSLRVYDSIHPPATLVRPDVVRTDLITANFTYAFAAAPNLYQFTDTSTGGPTGWAWDFDNDGIVDSNVQNPLVPLASCSTTTVRLDVTRNCRSATVSRELLPTPATLNAAPAPATGTNPSTPVGAFFNVSVQAAEGVQICGLTSPTFQGIGPYNVLVYLTPDTYVGKDANAAAWRLVSTGVGNMGGGTLAAPSRNLIALNTPVYLPQGNYGLAIYHQSLTGLSWMSYTNGTVGPFANGDLTINPVPASAPGLVRTNLFGGTVFTPRMWSGTLHYRKTSLDGSAGYGIHSFGCAGSAGVPGNVVVTPPTVGGTLSVDFTNLPFGAALVLASQLRFNPGIDLGFLQAPGCPLYNNLDLQFIVVSATTTANLQAPIPADPLLIGSVYWVQALSLDVVNAFGFTTSDGAGTIIGG